MEKLNQQVVEEWIRSVTGEFHFTRVLDRAKTREMPNVSK